MKTREFLAQLSQSPLHRAYVALVAAMGVTGYGSAAAVTWSRHGWLVQAAAGIAAGAAWLVLTWGLLGFERVQHWVMTGQWRGGRDE